MDTRQSNSAAKKYRYRSLLSAWFLFYFTCIVPIHFPKDSFAANLASKAMQTLALLLSAMSFAVWLHGFYDGAKQSSLNCASLPNHAGSQQRLWLPKSDWSASCLSANKVDNPARRRQGSDAPSRPLVRALALVKTGKVWDGVLTPLSDQELLGFEFFGYPTDFFP